MDNEVNGGLGLSYEFHDDVRGAAFVAAGFYKDSGRNWAKLAGPGYQLKFGDRWRLGMTLPLIQSGTYNKGRAFAIGPSVKYDSGKGWFVTAKWQKELAVRNRPEGSAVWLKAVFPL